MSLSTSLRCLLFALGVTQRATTLLAAIHSISPTSGEPRAPPWGRDGRGFWGRMGKNAPREPLARRLSAEVDHQLGGNLPGARD